MLLKLEREARTKGENFCRLDSTPRLAVQWRDLEEIIVFFKPEENFICGLWSGQILVPFLLLLYLSFPIILSGGEPAS